MSLNVPDYARVKELLTETRDYNQDKSHAATKQLEWAFRDARLAAGEHEMQREIILDQARTIARLEAEVMRLTVHKEAATA
jgi:hypothetical protein